MYPDTNLSWLAGFSWSSRLVIAGLQAGFRRVLATSLAGHAGLHRSGWETS